MIPSCLQQICMDMRTMIWMYIYTLCRHIDIHTHTCICNLSHVFLNIYIVFDISHISLLSLSLSDITLCSLQFVTTNGVAEFAYTMGTYGYNSPISSSDVSSLPMCEYDGNGYYYGVGCSSSGTFTIDRFSDAYCTQYYDTYDKLSNLNSALKSLSKCYYIYSTRSDEDPSYSLANYLIQESTSCSSAENNLCTTSEFVANSGSYASKQKTFTTTTSNRSNLSKLTDKLKYTLGTAMLCGSAIMFVGILFTNRKKRRAMMHGKLKSKPDAAKTKSRSKSRSSSEKKRSSSKKKTSSSSGVAREGGIFA